MVSFIEEDDFQKVLFQTVIENIQDMFIITDESGNILLMNNTLRKYISDCGEVKDIYDIYMNFKYYTLDGVRISYENLPSILALKGFYSKDEILIVRRDDKEQVVSINTYPIFDKSRSIKLFVSHYKDITSQIQNQILLQRQQDRIIEIEKEKIEALNREVQIKDEFLSIISHESRHQ